MSIVLSVVHCSIIHTIKITYPKIESTARKIEGVAHIR